MPSRASSRDRDVEIPSLTDLYALMVAIVVIIALLTYITTTSTLRSADDARAAEEQATAAEMPMGRDSLEQLRDMVDFLNIESNNFTISAVNPEFTFHLQGYGNDAPTRDAYCLTVRSDDGSAFYSTSFDPGQYVSAGPYEAYVCQ